MAIKIPSESEYQAMAAAYVSGATLKEAASTFGYSERAATTALRRAGITARSSIPPRGPEGIQAPKEHQDAMVQAYLEGASLRQAAAILGYSTATAQRVLHERGIARRTSGAREKYERSHDFFEVIDSEEKAYWLGFITADGCNHGKLLRVALKATDARHLEKLAAAICPDKSFTIGSGGKSASFDLWSPKMCSDLNALGVTPRKSLTVAPWQGPSELLRHYWRGLVDGDGWVIKEKRGHCIGLCGSAGIVSGFAEWAKCLTGHTATISKTGASGRIHRVRFSSADSVRILSRELYEGALVALDRKAKFVRENLTP